MSAKKILQDISIDNFHTKLNFSYFYPQIDLLTYIYTSSIINLESYGKTCALISMNSSNNQRNIDEMSFWYFNNYMVYFYEFLNEKNGNEETTENPQESASKQFTSSMSNAKSMMKNQKLSGMKMPKK